MSNDKKIWDALQAVIGNEYGTAGMMGNLKAESGLNPATLESTFRKKLGMTSQEYTAAVDDGSYSREDFCRDGAGYGLAQWTYWEHKQALYDLAKAEEKSIGDLGLQLDYLAIDLQKWKYVLNRLRVAKSVKEASDLVLTVYLKPANTGDKVKAKRAGYGEEFYKLYAKGDNGMIKAVDFLRLIRQAYNERWGYIWGTYGQTWTQKDQDNATREQTIQYGSKWIGKRVADCSGLAYWAFRELGGQMYHGSNTMWRDYVTDRATLTDGKRSDGAELWPGDPVFLYRDGSRYHVGYYVGNGNVIEAAGTKSGVIVSRVTKWNETARWINVLYENGRFFKVRPVLKMGKSGIDVRDLQELLTAAGYPLDADGVFGTKTFQAVKAFQFDHSLTADGVVGSKTWAALEGDKGQNPAPDAPIDGDDMSSIATAINAAIEGLDKAIDNLQAVKDALGEVRYR
jgi:cell wall-associated NlpC family hydrolase